jgi:hypothetical protein
VDAVTENRKKELARLKRESEFRASNELGPSKGGAANQKVKIDHEDQIKSIKERIENFQKEICPICFDEPQDALLRSVASESSVPRVFSRARRGSLTAPCPQDDESAETFEADYSGW